MNWNARLRNPYFWIGLVGVIFSAMGVDPATLTSWGVLYEKLIALVTNPFAIGSVIMAVLGVIVDPSTKGLRDNIDKTDF